MNIQNKDDIALIMIFLFLLLLSSCQDIQVTTEYSEYSKKLASSPDCHSFFEKRNGDTFYFVKCKGSEERFGEFKRVK